MTPRQEVNKIYTEGDYAEKLQSDILMGQQIKEMMNTTGWNDWFYPMVDQLMQNLNSIEDVSTLKELEGRKQTYKALKLLFDKLNELVDIANGAVIQLNQYKDSAKDS